MTMFSYKLFEIFEYSRTSLLGQARNTLRYVHRKSEQLRRSNRYGSYYGNVTIKAIALQQKYDYDSLTRWMA